MNNAKHGLVEVCVRIDNNGIFSAHFADDLLQVSLIWMRYAGRLPDLRADLARSGERHKINVWMDYKEGTYSFALSKQKISDAAGKAGFLKQIHELRSDHGGLFRRFHDDRISSDQGGYGHSA